MSADQTAVDVLASFLRIVDALEERDRPAVELRCPCGGSLTVGRTVQAGARRDLVTHFNGTHHNCVPHDCIATKPDPKEATE